MTDQASGIVIERNLHYSNVSHSFRLIKNSLEIEHSNCVGAQGAFDGSSEIIPDVAGDILLSYRYDGTCMSIKGQPIGERARMEWQTGQSGANSPFYKPGDLVTSDISGYSKYGFQVVIDARKGEVGHVSIKALGPDKATDFKMIIECE